MADYNVLVGGKIRGIRLSRGFSQAELGRLIGYSQNTVAGWETGRRSCRLEVLERIAVALRIPVDALIPRESETEGGPSLSTPWPCPAVILERLDQCITKIDRVHDRLDRMASRFDAPDSPPGDREPPPKRG